MGTVGPGVTKKVSHFEVRQEATGACGARSQVPPLTPRVSPVVPQQPGQDCFSYCYQQRTGTGWGPLPF